MFCPFCHSRYYPSCLLEAISQQRPPLSQLFPSNSPFGSSSSPNLSNLSILPVHLITYLQLLADRSYIGLAIFGRIDGRNSWNVAACSSNLVLSVLIVQLLFGDDILGDGLVLGVVGRDRVFFVEVVGRSNIVDENPCLAESAQHVEAAIGFVSTMINSRSGRPFVQG